MTEELKLLIKHLIDTSPSEFHSFLEKQQLSENFIKELIIEFEYYFVKNNYMVLCLLLIVQKISEQYIKELILKYNLVNDRDLFDIIVCHQTLSDDFVREFDRQLCNDKNIMMKFWSINFSYHRMLGPAVIYASGEKEYWYRGKRLFDIKNDKQYERWLNLRMFA